ncbi:ferric reductase transmembrane component 4 precursor [Apiospora marii]|uniref:Ferric reductase transmembrane component 4 n=1 Tax=Apiospora marii TaxID=335849 RepID=A0ABR1RF14_9PEZI
MDSTQWYAVALGAIFFVLVVSRLEKLGTSIVIFPVNDIRDIEKRAAILALTNLTPLFFSGQTHSIADWLGLSMSLYQTMHRCLVTLTLRPRAGLILTSGASAGGCVALLLSLPLIKYLLMRLGARTSKGIKPVLRPRIHTIIALGAISSAFWHVTVLPQASPATKGSVLSACSLWAILTLARIFRIIYLGTSVTVAAQSRNGDMVRIQVDTKRRVLITPGSYFYLFCWGTLCVHDISQGKPLMAIPAGDDADATLKGALSLIFIVPIGSSPGLAKALRKGNHLILDGPYGQSPPLGSFENVILAAQGSGILTALPMATFIASRKRCDSLSRSRLLQVQERSDMQTTSDPESETRRMDEVPRRLFRDLTRKIDIYWILDSNSDENWLAAQISQLQMLDADRVSSSKPLLQMYADQKALLFLWCFYPSPRTTEVPFSITDHFRCSYPSDPDQFNERFLEEKVEEEAMTAGDTILIACGSNEFTDVARKSMLRVWQKGYPVRTMADQAMTGVTAAAAEAVAAEAAAAEAAAAQTAAAEAAAAQTAAAEAAAAQTAADQAAAAEAALKVVAARKVKGDANIVKKEEEDETFNPMGYVPNTRGASEEADGWDFGEETLKLHNELPYNTAKEKTKDYNRITLTRDPDTDPNLGIKPTRGKILGVLKFRGLLFVALPSLSSATKKLARGCLVYGADYPLEKEAFLAAQPLPMSSKGITALRGTDWRKFEPIATGTDGKTWYILGRPENATENGLFSRSTLDTAFGRHATDMIINVQRKRVGQALSTRTQRLKVLEGGAEYVKDAFGRYNLGIPDDFHMPG